MKDKSVTYFLLEVDENYLLEDRTHLIAFMKTKAWVIGQAVKDAAIEGRIPPGIVSGVSILGVTRATAETPHILVKVCSYPEYMKAPLLDPLCQGIVTALTQLLVSFGVPEGEVLIDAEAMNPYPGGYATNRSMPS